MAKKKVLGISFGRNMSNCDVMVKHALMEASNYDCEVKFIRADDLNLKICTGCIACVIGLISGRGKGDCVQKDEFHILDEAILDADAIILASPTYETSPTGTYKIVCDRVGPSHDITFRQAAYDEGLAAGKDPSELPDSRSFKKRTAALISVGGAMTKNWLSFTLPIMYEFTMPMGIDVIDLYEYYGAMAHEHVLGNEKVMERMRLIGQHIAESANAKSEEDRTKWRGDEEGTCPVCHLNMLSLSEDRKSVECPVCGIAGKLTLDESGEIRVEFSEEEQKRSRLFWEGKLEHSTEIKTRAAHPGQIPDLKMRKEKYKGYAAEWI